jgi:hypothetical protein
VGSAGGELYATPDGEYLVGRAGSPTLSAWNRIARTPVPSPIRIDPGWHVLGQPSRLEVYGIDQTGHVIAVSPEGERRLAVPSPCVPVSIRGLSGDGRRLAIGCAGISSVGIVVYDLDRQQVIRQLPDSAFPLAFSADGTALFMFVELQTLRKISIDTGDVLAERRLPHAGWVYVDPYSSRVFVAGDHRVTMPEDGTEILDPETLSTVATAPAELGAIWVFDPDRPLAYTLKKTPASGGYRTRLLAVDTGSLTEIEGAELPTPFLTVSLTLVPRPSAPLGVTAVVEGRRVQLSWTRGARGIATSYVVEAGSGPGLADIAVIDAGARTSVVVDPVPPGRYFVRVRAVNLDGPGVASSEATIVVP